MTIPLTGTGGLFTRLGQLIQALSDINVFQAGTFATDMANINAQYASNPAFIDGIGSTTLNSQNSIGSVNGTLSTYAANTVNGMVLADNPQLTATNLLNSLQELIYQMNEASQTVKQSIITQTITAFSGNLGNGVLVGSFKTSDGLVAENTFAENVVAYCRTDVNSGANFAGNEIFGVYGQVYYTPFDWRYPGGSGAQSSLTCLNGSNNNSGGNLLNNGGFENFTSNTPNNWTVITGTPGTTILKSTASPYVGLADLEYAGNGSENTAIAQTFALTAGTSATLSALTQYAFNCWVSVSATPAAGVLEIALVNSSNTVIDDAQGNPCSATLALTGVSTTYVPFNGVFNTPQEMPSTVKLIIKLSTPLSSGKNVFIDQLAFGATKQLYNGGPSFAMFSGSENFYADVNNSTQPDTFTAAFTNDQGGSSNGKHFMLGFDRFFNMRNLGLQLPSSASPTIADTLT